MNKIKVNFYRFVDTIVEEIDVVQGKNDIPTIQGGLNELKKEAEEAKNTLGRMMDAIVPSKAASSLKQMRNVTKNNIVNMLKEAETYIKNANASDRFKLQIKAEQDKFAALDKSTDYRTAAKTSEVNKFSGLENRLINDMSAEASRAELTYKKEEANVNKGLLEIVKQTANERQKEVEILRKESDAETNLLRAQERINNSVREEGRARKENSAMLSEAGGFIKGFSNGILGISNGSKSFLKHITGVAVTFRILGGVVSGITNTFKNLYDTAASYEEAVNLYRTALGDYAEQADQWANRISTALHLDPKDVMQYTGALYNLVQGLGVGADAAYTMATNMTQLAYDMSSYLNIDVESAYGKIQSAITGQARAVAKAGVAMQIASLQELAYSMGIKKSVNEMTQAEKTYLRYIQLMRSTTNMQQDLGKTILTPENALRVLRAEFIQFARALGQVVIPIVLKVIPYLTALANMLTEVAHRIAAAFGFQMTKINYDNFDTGNEKLKTLNKNLKGTGASAKTARDEIQRTLAPFDELNVVENESKGGGGAGGAGGAGSDILPQLEDYVTGYDMLGKLTKDFDNSVAEARKNLEKMIPVIKGIAIAFGLWQLAKRVASFVDMIDKFKLGIKEGTGFGGVLKTLGTRFSEGYRYAKALGGEGLGAIQYGIKNMLGPIGTLVATLGLMTASFASSFTILKNWNGETDNLVLRLVGAGGLVAALTVTAGVFLGPWAAAGVAVAGLVGGIIGLEEALARERLEAEKQRGFPELFENQGIAISGAYKLVGDGLKNVTDSATELQKLMDANDEVKSSWDNAKTAFEQFQLQLSNGEITYSNNAELVKGITTEVDKLTDAGNKRIEDEKLNEIAMLDILKKETNMTDEEYNERKKIIEDYYEKQNMYQKGYYEQYKKLLIQRQEGTITEQQFRDEVTKLQKEYMGLNDTTAVATEYAKNYLEAQNGKIDLESPEKFNEIIKDAISKRSEYIKQEDESHNRLIDYYKEQIQGQEDIKKAIEEQYGAYDNLDEKQKGFYDEATKRIDSLQTNIETAETAHALSVQEINATFKNFLGTTLLELAATGNDSSETFRESVSLINGDLLSIGKGVDPSGSAVDFMGKFANTMIKEGKTISADQQARFMTYGIDVTGKYGDGLLDGTSKAMIGWKVKMDNAMDDNVRSWKNKAKEGSLEVGNESVLGIRTGYSKSANELYGTVADVIGKTDTVARDTLGIHSPSRVFMDIGQNVAIGLANGIRDNGNKVEAEVRNMVNRAKNAASGASVGIKIDTNVEGSFNTILNKLQKFCNNWKTAINSLMTKTRDSLNSMKMNNNGKVSFTTMGSISVPKFAEGGFPTSGDLFFANENGIPEYITSIGNRSAVANQDQMVSALSGAILTAMSKIPTNTQPSNITVYVGDKKLYEGQGEYQNRQNDRYGTTVVRI